MNNIPIAQNEQNQILRLGAQRQLYATAKTIFLWQLIISGPCTIAATLLANWLPVAKPVAAFWGIIAVLSDLLWLTPWQKHLKESGAKVQEMFDCDVLQLPWSEVKAGKRPDPELVKEQSDKYSKWAATMSPLEDWYGTAIGALPLHVGRIACQRSNCWWDSKQRRQYAAWIIGSVTVVFALIVLCSLGGSFELAEFLVNVVVPFSPALILAFRQFNEQMETASKLDKLKEHSEKLWEKSLNGASKQNLTQGARSLQDEIFENRKRNPLVFDRIFKRFRNDYETQMTHGIEEFVSEAKKKLGLA